MKARAGVLAATVCLVALASAPDASAGRPAAVRLAAPARPRSATSLLRRYRQLRGPVAPRGERLRFAGVGGRDVYNPTRPFVIGGRRVMAGRVESRASETDSSVVFFEERGDGWHPIPGSPRLPLQDPFTSAIGGQVVVGGVQVVALGDGRTRYRTVFYRGGSLGTLERFAAGPWGMKDIRLAPLADGRIFVLTRPQGSRGGRGKIGYTVIDSLEQLTPQRIARARVIEGQFPAAEWGGANEVTVLGPERLGVLGHIARMDSRGARHYYPMAFEIDLATQQVSEARMLVERRDLPGGLRGAAKRRDLRDVLFSGGLERHGDGRATLYLGAGDVETYAVEVADPFVGR